VAVIIRDRKAEKTEGTAKGREAANAEKVKRFAEYRAVEG